MLYGVSSDQIFTNNALGKFVTRNNLTNLAFLFWVRLLSHESVILE